MRDNDAQPDSGSVVLFKCCLSVLQRVLDLLHCQTPYVCFRVQWWARNVPAVNGSKLISLGGWLASDADPVALQGFRLLTPVSISL